MFNVQPTAVYSYVRVSSTRQGDKGLSLQEQVERCKAYATRMGWPIATTTKEIISAYNKVQIKLRNLIDSALPGSIILVTSYDRFSRNVLQGVSNLTKLASKRVRILSVQEPVDTLTPAGRYAFHIQLASSEFNSANSGHKIKETIAKLRRDGNHIGSASYGNKVIVEGMGDTKRRLLVEDGKQRITIRLIQELRAGINADSATKLLYQIIPEKDQAPIEFYDGDHKIDYVQPKALTFTDIADLLNQYSVPYRNNKPWSVEAVRRVHREKQ